MAKAGTSIIRWEDTLAADAKLAAVVEANTGLGNFISTRGGLQYAGAPIPGNKMNAIILDHIAANLYYAEKFDPDDRASPTCYAYGHAQPDGTMPDMKPHEKASEPQHEKCAGCQWDAWGTADNGKGKACKNVRRLALIHADVLQGKVKDIGDIIRKSPVAFLNIPVTSVGGWANYVRSLANVMKRPPYAVVTTIEWVTDPKTQFKLLFSAGAKITDTAALTALKELNTKYAVDIMFPYPANEERATRSKSRKAPAKKKAGRR